MNVMEYYWFIFCKSDLLLEKTDKGYSIPLSEESPVALRSWTQVMKVSPTINGYEVRALNIDTPITNDLSFEMCNLRASYYKLQGDFYLAAGKCHELLYWNQNTQFCGKCGSPMKLHTEISKQCTNCGREIWPQVATAVIVLIHREDEVLLVHAKNFKSDFYGLVAGFVETGETLEEAVYREVMEETGIKIKNLTYFGSQTWPYPCGLMVGFNADYVSGEIKLQESELSKGAWFRKDNLPTLPEKLSIARKLIDNWLENNY